MSDLMDDLAALGLPEAAAPVTSAAEIRARAAAIAPVGAAGWSTARTMAAAAAAMVVGTGMGGALEHLRHGADVVVVPRLVAIHVPADAPPPVERVVERVVEHERVVTVVRRVEVPAPAEQCAIASEDRKPEAEIPDGWLDADLPPPSPAPAVIEAPRVADLDRPEDTPSILNTRWRASLGAALADRPRTEGADLGPVASLGLWHAFGDGAVAPMMAGDVSVGAGTLSGVSPGLAAEIGGTWRKGKVGVDVGWSVASRLVSEEVPLPEGRGPGAPAPDTRTRAALGTGPAVSVALGEADGTRVRTGVALHAVPDREGTGFEALWTLGLDHGIK